ncbi:hypothetical protein ACQP3L_37190, partial [Escherichia coli]
MALGRMDISVGDALKIISLVLRDLDYVPAVCEGTIGPMTAVPKLIRRAILFFPMPIRETGEG